MTTSERVGVLIGDKVFIDDPRQHQGDPIKRALSLLDEVAATLRSLRVPVPRAETVHSNAKKLTKREVRDIREMRRTTDVSQAELADIYSVHPATISRIVRGQYWK